VMDWGPYMAPWGWAGDRYGTKLWLALTFQSSHPPITIKD
jgi:hypothetical protein